MISKEQDKSNDET